MADRRSALVAAAFDASPSECAVLAPDGRILAVNRAWQRFGTQNGAGSGCGVGANYRRVTERSAAAGDDVAAVVVAALVAVLEGHAPRARLDYPCHSPTEQRWFRLRLEPLRGRPELLVVHDDITEHVREVLQPERRAPGIDRTAPRADL